MKMQKVCFSYLLSALALFLFQMVYHYFGHGVVSVSLKFVWLLPIGGFCVFWLLDALFGLGTKRAARNSYHASLAIFANGLILQGILEIAGSNSPYVQLYYLSGVLLLITGLLLLNRRLGQE